MTLRGVWEVASTGIVALAAVTILVLHLHDRNQEPVTPGAEPTSHDDWESWGTSGIRVGAPDASMVVATFMDFNCPYCGKLAPVLDSLRTDFPDRVAIEHYHFPLRRHDFAVPSAQAAECAHRQGRFWAMYLSLFSQMDSIGTRSWRDFASDAGVPNTGAFEACMALPLDPHSADRISHFF